MSRSRTKRKAPKYQRAKLAVLPFLLAILGYVVLGGSESDTDDALMQAAQPKGLAAARQRPASSGKEGPEAQPTKQADWSELTASRRAGCNPFLPIVKEEEEAPPAALAELSMPTEDQPLATEIAQETEPSAVPAPAPEEPTVDVAALSRQPVRYFFQTDNRRVMLVGDQLLSEGQTLESFTVTRLEPNRIELEPAP